MSSAPVHRFGDRSSAMLSARLPASLSVCLPDYGGASIVNLAASIAASFDAVPAVPPVYPQLVALAPQLQAARTVVLVVLDGVGERQLTDHVADGCLARQRVASLRSVFPSSTAPAITSLVSAQTPARHGNPGWFMHDPARGDVIRTLPMDRRGAPAMPVGPDIWRWRSWMQGLGGAVLALQPRVIAESAYSRHVFDGCERSGWRTLEDIAPALRRLAGARGDGRRFAWVYVPDFDGVAHDTGCRSKAARDCLRRLDAWVDALIDALRGTETLILVTADHGFVDIEPPCRHHLHDWPALAGCLAAPLAGEPRVVFCRVRPDRLERFDALATDALAAICTAVPAEQLLAQGWLGPHSGPDIAPRIGERVLLMHDGHTLTDCLPGEHRDELIGMHGGATVDEMQVPLIIAAP